MSDADILAMHVRFIGDAPKIVNQPKLRGINYRLPMMIVNTEKVPDPERRIDRIFDLLLKVGLKEGEKVLKNKPKSFSMNIDSPAYDYENPRLGTLGIYRRNLNQNNPSMIANAFLRVEQSRRALKLNNVPLEVNVDMYVDEYMPRGLRLRGTGGYDDSIED